MMAGQKPLQPYALLESSYKYYGQLALVVQSCSQSHLNQLARLLLKLDKDSQKDPHFLIQYALNFHVMKEYESVENGFSHSKQYILVLHTLQLIVCKNSLMDYKWLYKHLHD